MDMSSSMSMAPTATSMSMSMSMMPSSSGMSMSSDGMGMGMDMSGMQMGMMMTFYTSTSTPLFSTSFTPHTTGQYAGMCIFLIVLSLSLRFLLAYRCFCEARWMRSARKRRYVVVAGNGNEPGANGAADADSDVSSETSSRMAADEKISGTAAVLTTNGVRDNVRIIDDSKIAKFKRQPWRLSVDLPRAILGTVILGVGYLLMLAVMTMNVGYFLSVLAGAFVGELFLGRYLVGHEEGH